MAPTFVSTSALSVLLGATLAMGSATQAAEKGVGSSAAWIVGGPIVINQSVAVRGLLPGDQPGFPLQITRSGSYALGSNINASIEGGILVTAPNVTLDMRGFTITGKQASYGVFTNLSTTLRNGSISNFAEGVVGSQGLIIDGVRITGNKRGIGLTQATVAMVSNSMIADADLGVKCSLLTRVLISNTIFKNTQDFDGCSSDTGATFGVFQAK